MIKPCFIVKLKPLFFSTTSAQQKIVNSSTVLLADATNLSTFIAKSVRRIAQRYTSRYSTVTLHSRSSSSR